MASVHFWTVAPERFIAPTFFGVEAIKLSGHVITTIKNQLDIINGEKEGNGNYSVIDLKECGDLLKSAYNLDPDTDLIVLKYENIVNNSNDKSIQYEVYAPNITDKLNLSICTETNVNIEVYVPVQLDEETKAII